MSYDLLIKHGTLVDGTGAPPVHVDVAVKDGYIVEVGKLSGRAQRTIDAADLIVAPGFVDPHTHYDAQICWDDVASPSSWHGVTTIMLGNCGVGLAPCRPAAREVAAWDLVNVEAIPFDVLQAGVSWDWESFPEYMAAAARRGSGLNMGFLCALTPFRHYVMGEASMERAATPAEMIEVTRLLREAMVAGAFGFTTTSAPQHLGYKGRPRACRLASHDELRSYSRVLKDLGHGAIEIALTSQASKVNAEERALLELLLTESGRPVTWLALLNCDDDPDAVQNTLKETADLIARGAIAQCTCRPFIFQIDVSKPFILASMACWVPVLNQPLERQIEILRSTSFRAEFRAALQRPLIFTGRWEVMTVLEVTNPQLAKYVGRNIAEIAQARGSDPLDTFLDLAIEGNLAMQFNYILFNADESRIPELITGSRTMIGLSDGGAHVDSICDAGYVIFLLGTWVRDRQVISLKHAIKGITSEPADFFGIKKRGRIAPGMAARGVEYTIVNGKILFEHGVDSGARAGQVLHSANA